MATPRGLKETKLLPETEDEIQSVGGWASTAKFNVSKEQSWETCVDEDRETRIKTLLDRPGVQDKAADKLSRHYIIRISGPIPGNFGTSQGPAYVYPLRIHPGTNPRISGISLKVGTVVEITNSSFVITHGADFLIILTVSRNMVQVLPEKAEGSSSERQEP